MGLLLGSDTSHFRWRGGASSLDLNLFVKQRGQMRTVLLQQAGAALSALEMINGLSWTEWRSGTRLYVFYSKQQTYARQIVLPGC